MAKGERAGSSRLKLFGMTSDWKWRFVVQREKQVPPLSRMIRFASHSAPVGMTESGFAKELVQSEKLISIDEEAD